MSEHPTLPAPPPVHDETGPDVVPVTVTILPERIVVTGAPLSGSVGIALDLAGGRGLQVRETDATIALGLSWSEASAHVAEWFEAEGPWVVHGVAVPRALRKWLAAHAGDTRKPCDVVIFDRQPLAVLTKGQETMRKGIETVWSEIAPLLEARGVEIEVRG